MTGNVCKISGTIVLECPSDGPLLRTSQDAVDLIGEAVSANASLVVLPMARLDPEFFQLRSGVAGEFVQRFVTYRLGLIVLGDTSKLAAASKALHDFIYESNRRGSIWFLADRSELEKRLAPEAAAH